VKFKLGQCVASSNAVGLMDRQRINPLHLLMRHVNGDWGDLDAEDKELNDAAVASGEERIFSAYVLPSGDKLWVITEHDRSLTTMLLPDDY